MSNSDDSPWLHIPAADYEGHMGAIGQAGALREVFAAVYAERRPLRLAVLGCSTGGDLQLVDPAVTEVVVGVDINPAYLEIARRRLAALGPALQLVRGDVLSVELPRARFDLVHAALLLEYVDPSALFRRMQQWLAPHGLCSVVTQDPIQGAAPVSSTQYQSLQNLNGRMSLRRADEIAALASREGFRAAGTRVMKLSSGKSLTSSIFHRGVSDG